VKVLLDPQHAAPAVRSMAPTPKRRVKRTLRDIADDPMNRTGKLDFKRLDSTPGIAIFRVRVGDWRIVYTIDKDIVVLRIFHRGDGYGWVADLE
jgi:mRNA-degrading endonuclease RelE of RelBE toxin-antitoxin system